jgi:HSP20 family protein
MIENNDKEFEIRIASSSISSLFNDDVEHQILSPLSCLREYGTHWLLEFDLPLVIKKISKLHLMKILLVLKLN